MTDTDPLDAAARAITDLAHALTRASERDRLRNERLDHLEAELAQYLATRRTDEQGGAT